MNAPSGLPGSQSLKILRIKRKRDEEPPELLVVEPSKRGSKRRKSGIDVFQFAETVDASAWKTIQEDELRTRISNVAGSSSPKKASEKNDAEPVEPISRKASANGSSRQYRIVVDDFDTKKRSLPSSRSGPLPPRVLPSKDLNKPASKLTIYDAILDSSASEADPTAEMDQFQSLLKEYLSMSDSKPNLSSASSVRSSLSTSGSGSTSDYVYDIFYYRPSTLADQVAASGMSMATVTGLPVEFDDDYELESDGELEDEADEDSNDENYFKNDYPDEESSDDEDEHYSSDDFDVHSARFEPDYD